MLAINSINNHDLVFVLTHTTGCEQDASTIIEQVRSFIFLIHASLRTEQYYTITAWLECKMKIYLHKKIHIERGRSPSSI